MADEMRDYAARRAQYKKTVDAETGQRHREQHAIKIRKDKREQQEKAKRLQLSRVVGASSDAAVPPLTSMSVSWWRH